MDSIFKDTTISCFIERINKISESSIAEWGKMNPYQMLKHCTESEKVNLGELKLKRLFIGRLFGRVALQSIIKDGAKEKKNSPTHPALVISETGDVEQQKVALINQLKKYSKANQSAFASRIHPFFGKMSINEWDMLICKHLDHHLRQFGV
ncbi:DUF1569 domain-containing protein [Flammeovirgaceae bacterium SG7u.111]|nr:DUF1569 domain-containing protein [Flammeovirgaceae bacterium SG7u.132]WPO37308.1 DUF1569 domain-containing protein [Flammeovirgaceae bacterium SG7u.111]